jgi:Protein of unknown function (DUF3142)
MRFSGVYFKGQRHSSTRWLILLALLTVSFSLAASGLPQEVYVWQRAWTEPVRRSVAEHGEVFERIVVLKAEVTWQGSKPQLVQIPVDYPSLVQIRRPVGLALRIGPYSGAFSRTNAAITFLTDLSEKLVIEAREAGVSPSELQLDFDCASSKLDGYRAWVEAIRTRVAPVPVVITVLPAWLDQPAFKPLVQAADGFVLQVHSLERPRSVDAAFTLCDPANARRAVAKAAQIGVPFRVALPTYGYTMAFDSKGRFVGLSAEGSAKSWPAGSQSKEARADPLQISQLVQEWSSNTPPALKAILWYRLPIQGDTLNWRWPTLSAILQSRTPRKSVRVESHRVEPGLIEIGLVNDGELDISSRLAVKTRWSGARLVAGDGLHGFEVADRGVSSARFETGARSYRLPAGEQQVIGWLRLGEDREVQIEIEEPDGR